MRTLIPLKLINAPLDPGFYLSFWVYPKADALACLGWYHTHLGLEAEDAENASLEFDQAAKYYAEAGTILPGDEEKALIYLRSAVEAHWYNNHSARVYMPLVLKIMNSEEAMLEIWENSPISESRDASLLQVLEFGVLLTDTLQAGKYTKDDIIKPRELKELDKFPSTNVLYL
ncbi:hypothetical protein CPB83DRAFT_641428 [Crepidotus variabilis]|uniref:Uncharacterized protein n=1 Tax=Crepidotus variabilis TaxID=179855 RepID=A0A9P6JKB5_9AGAR|nr:hypothetical protein CPB83DRAFT_641428 [Crepidotus variabilis]